MEHIKRDHAEYLNSSDSEAPIYRFPDDIYSQKDSSNSERDIFMSKCKSASGPKSLGSVSDGVPLRETYHLDLTS